MNLILRVWMASLNSQNYLDIVPQKSLLAKSSMSKDAIYSKHTTLSYGITKLFNNSAYSCHRIKIVNRKHTKSDRDQAYLNIVSRIIA